MYSDSYWQSNARDLLKLFPKTQWEVHSLTRSRTKELFLESYEPTK